MGFSDAVGITNIPRPPRLVKRLPLPLYKLLSRILSVVADTETTQSLLIEINIPFQLPWRRMRIRFRAMAPAITIPTTARMGNANTL